MKATISLYSKDGECLDTLSYDKRSRRIEIMENWGKRYGPKFNTMYVIIAPEPTLSMPTNPDGTNVNFGGRHKGRQSGFHFKHK